MRVMSFTIDGKPSFGLAVDNGVIDAGKRLEGKYRGLRDALIAGALPELRKLEKSKPDYAVKDVQFLPVIPDAGAKFLCIGINYIPHIKEMGRERPEHPVVFVRFQDSLVGHGLAIERPQGSVQLDWEGELAVIIGRTGRRIPKEKAMSHVAGYACYNDGSVRDWQRHTSQWVPGKNFWRTGGFGPWMVTADEIPDPSRMTLVTRLNGQELQRATTDLLIFDIPTLISYCSDWTELVPGDVIVTGTPGGVGFVRNPPIFMKPGDTVEVDVDKIGVLANPIAQEK